MQRSIHPVPPIEFGYCFPGIGFCVVMNDRHAFLWHLELDDGTNLLELTLDIAFFSFVTQLADPDATTLCYSVAVTNVFWDSIG